MSLSRPATDDFASGAMMDVLRGGLRAQGLLDPGAGGGRSAARVPRGDKGDLLAAAVARHGVGPLLRLDAGLDALAGRPVYEALVAGGTPWRALERWGRLERYVHGRHRTQRTPVDAQGAGDDACEVRHLGTGATPPPALESLAVLGVQAALLRRCGARGLQARIDGRDALEGDTAWLEARIARGPCDRWTFEWQGDAATHAPPAAVEPHDPALPGLVDAVARLVGGDLLRRWRLDDVAQALGVPKRSLQRAMAAAGLGFTAILEATRQRVAARLLRDTDTPLAEIGYRCGYADQAHFNRRFERDVGLPPGRYRAQFARREPAVARPHPAEDPTPCHAD